VVELSAVDEASLERTLNEWTARGWQLENVQFAMRESSKRPSMAFVFFTREAAGEGAEAPDAHDAQQARRRLVRLSEQGPTAAVALDEEPAQEQPLMPPRPVSQAWERLRQLAEEDDEGGGA
jgi:hypothetical protein